MRPSAWGLLLTKSEFLVFRCIPPFWFDENTTIREIALRTDTAQSIVRNHVTRFVQQNLIERRASTTDIRDVEIRRTVSIKDVTEGRG